MDPGFRRDDESKIVAIVTYPLVPDLGLDRVDIGGGHFTDGGDFTLLDAPQAEGAGDVAILIEGNRADDAFILDRFAVLDELERFGEFLLAGMDHRALGIEHLVDRVLDRSRVRFAGLRDGEADNGARIIGAVSGRIGRIDT